MSDLINRQAAIDVINESNSPIAEYLIGEIMALPSAQEKRTDKRTETHACDCISRAAAIDAAHKCAVKEVTPAYMLIDKAEVMTELMKLPSAQPEIIRCRDCCYWIPGLITDNDCFIPPKCGKYQRGKYQRGKYQHMVGRSADDYCSYAERRGVSE